MKWRKLEQHSIENHSHIAQWVEQLRRLQVQIQLVNTFFFEKQYLLLGTPRMHRSGTWAKLNARHLGIQICWLLMEICFCSSFTARWRHWCRGKTGNSCHCSVVHSCQNHVDKNSGYQLSNPCLSLTSGSRFFLFFSFIALQWHTFWGFALTLRPLFSTCNWHCLYHISIGM